MDGISSRSIAQALMRDTVKIADRGGHLKRTLGPRRQGGPRSPDWRTTRLGWWRDRPLTLHRPRSSGIGLGRAAPKEKETKHAMVRFLATPGVAPGGGTLNGKCTELKLEKVGGSYKLHYGVGYSLITMASALGGLACVH